ncbi:hypothetical protein THAOC_32541, partial [Thalassiosira oceanica]
MPRVIFVHFSWRDWRAFPVDRRVPGLWDDSIDLFKTLQEDRVAPRPRGSPVMPETAGILVRPRLLPALLAYLPFLTAAAQPAASSSGTLLRTLGSLPRWRVWPLSETEARASHAVRTYSLGGAGPQSYRGPGKGAQLNSGSCRTIRLAMFHPYPGCGLRLADAGGVNRSQLFGSNFCPPHLVPCTPTAPHGPLEPQTDRGFFFLSAPLHTWNDHFHGQNCCEGKLITKESVFADAGYTAPILGFRRFGPMSSDLSYDVASGRVS